MIWRRYIICKTCNTPHTLRISIGHKILQEHTFHCANCKQQIKIALHIDQENADARLEFVDNCSNGNAEGTIVNLDSEFVLSNAELHQDKISPWMLQAINIHKTLDQRKTIIPPNKTLKPNLVLFEGNRDKAEVWKKVKKAWQLSIDKKDTLSSNIIKEIIQTDSIDFGINELLFEFFQQFLGKHLFTLFDEAAKVIGATAKTFPTIFKQYHQYYKTNLSSTFTQNYIDIFTEYFSSFSEYSQTLIYVLTNIPYPVDYVASSTDFNKVKMFYGNAYEIFTTHLQLLACLNNISKGRSFDQFEKMTLQKYITIDKANRANPIANCPEYHVLTKCLESSLRNASHHKAVLLSDSKKHIEYKSGGVGSLKRIPYGEYLFKCNCITTNLMVLIQLELLFNEMADSI